MSKNTDLSQLYCSEFLSDLVSYRSYAKYYPVLNRREVVEEIINRNMQMHLNKFPKLSKDILKAYRQIHDKKSVPSMRSMQFAGEPILRENLRNYNCSYLHAKYARCFAESFYIQLCGTGVGFSVQRHHVNQLPAIRQYRDETRFIIHDSIAGWADALDSLVRAYFYGSPKPVFDFSGIRAKGSALSHGSGKAPGPESLRIMLSHIDRIFKGAIGRKLRPIEVHDIFCYTAEAVLSGGVRRSSLISFFDKNETEMLECKYGEWWNKNPQRRMANNSVVFDRSSTTKQEFNDVFDSCIKSNAGEPGFFFTSDIEVGSNPCCEISLNHNQLCNLTSINMSGIVDNKDLENRVYSASLLGTLQATYTDFSYVGDSWKITTENEALLGVSQTGIADSPNLTSEQLNKAAILVKDVNEKYAKKLGINIAARTTCVKPEGNTSCFLGSSSGIHARYSDFYLRRIRINNQDNLAKYLKIEIPDLIEPDLFTSSDLVVTIPQMSSVGAIIREKETALQLLDRVIFYHDNWIKPGHRTGANTHNVSCTIEYSKEEIDGLRDRLWETRNSYNGISLLPKDTSSYKQAPFESCTQEIYEEYLKKIKKIDFSKVLEFEDNTELQSTIACGGGSCEFTGK